MNLQERIKILTELGKYILSNDPAWQTAKQVAYQKNPWFTEAFVDLSATNIATQFLTEENLTKWARHYFLDDQITPRTVGIVMAGNIPLVGFHDFLSVFISGHKQRCKCSSKDQVLLEHLIHQMTQWNPAVREQVQLAEMLKDCDAYIATGSDHTSRYFDYYFGRYPSVIRKNRTSVAVLDGTENEQDLELLADDIMQYFGLGCRNVSQIFVPENYDFVPLLNALRKYKSFFDHHKYRNNYDYQLAIYLMNNQYYMTNDCIVLIDNNSPFSPIGTLHYSYYQSEEDVLSALSSDERIQAIVNKKRIPFGQAQKPQLTDYADGVDIMQFLLTL